MILMKEWLSWLMNYWNAWGHLNLNQWKIFIWVCQELLPFVITGFNHWQIDCKKDLNCYQSRFKMLAFIKLDLLHAVQSWMYLRKKRSNWTQQAMLYLTLQNMLWNFFCEALHKWWKNKVGKLAHVAAYCIH